MIEFKPASLKQIKPHEYAARFLLGGLITVTTGIIADHYGAVIGGLFLAFPAIFPAAATMIERHEREKKRAACLTPGKRGRMVAGLDAGGAALGTIGLMVFAAILWLGLIRYPAWAVLIAASFMWMITVAGAWWLRRRIA